MSFGCAAALLLALAQPAGAVTRSGPVELGAAVNSWGFGADPDPRYRATLAGYQALTAESTMKIADLQPDRGRFEFGLADAIVAFARQHGQQVHGHTLAWCEDTWLPGWLTGRSWTRQELLRVLDQHITTVMAHFRGRVPSWDVVNEALNPDGTLRDCLWSRVIGPDWVEQAFRFAQRADPGARLFYNEIRAEVPNPRFEALMSMAADFLARGVPLHGIGAQMHFVRGAPPQAQIEEAMRRVGDLGLAVHVSELDVPIWYLGRTMEEKLARQADSYRTVAAACQAQPACFRITTWGFTDRYTWRGATSLPLPFDTEYGPKPAWAALQEVLRPPPPPADGPPPPPPGGSVPQAAQPSPPQAAAAIAPVRSAAEASLRYRGWVGGVTADDRRRRRGQGNYHALEFRVSPGRATRYRACLIGGSLREHRCWRRRTDSRGRSSIDVSRLVNDRGGPGRWKAVWRLDGRRVASWSFRLAPEGV